MKDVLSELSIALVGVVVATIAYLCLIDRMQNNHTAAGIELASHPLVEPGSCDRHDSREQAPDTAMAARAADRAWCASDMRSAALPAARSL